MLFTLRPDTRRASGGACAAPASMCYSRYRGRSQLYPIDRFVRFVVSLRARQPIVPKSIASFASLCHCVCDNQLFPIDRFVV